MKLPFLRSNGAALVGVDLGTSAVKVVSLTRQQNEVRVDAALSATLAEPGNSAQNVAPNPVQEAWRLMESASLQRRPVAIGMGGAAVIAKRLQLTMEPEEKSAQLDLAVRKEAAQHLPFPAAEVNLDYHLIELRESGAAEVMVVAARKDLVLERVQACNTARMTVKVVDFNPFAVLNCYEYNYQPEPDVTVALLNIGARSSSLSVVRGSEPQFTHELGIGGSQYTETLQRECKLSFEEAEAIKRRADRDPKCASAIDTVLHAMRLELRKTMDFYQAAGLLPTLGSIYLAGGSAALPGLSAMLHDEFAIAVETLDPFRRLPFLPGLAEPREGAARYAVAVGLALRALDGSTA